MKVSLFNPQTTTLDGVSLIEAGAGTGKTYTIEELFLRFLLEKEISVRNILVVTFTEAATAELRERIRGKIRSALDALLQQTHDGDDPGSERDKLMLALAEFDEAPIYTIHGFCLKMLNDFAFESNTLFDTEFLVDQSGLIDELSADYWRNQLYKAETGYVKMFLTHYPDPSCLADMAARIVSRPVKHILPKVTEISPQAHYDDVLKQYKKIKHQWSREGEAISNLLKANHYWYKNYHEKLDENLDQLVQFFETNRPFSDSSTLFNFTPEVIGKKTKKAGTPPEHPIFAGFAGYSASVQKTWSIITLDFINYARKELRVRKQQLNLRSYDDLLHDLQRALTKGSGAGLAGKIRKKFTVAMIDEFQDTDPIQYAIFSTIFQANNSSLIFIGDPKQSIYSFRGADIFSYLNAEKDAEHRYTLGVNYRSDQDLVEAVNTIFDFHNNPFLEKKIGFRRAESWSHKPPRSLLIDDTLQVPMNFWYRPSAGIGDSIGYARTQIVDGVVGHITRLLNLGAKGRAKLVSVEKEKELKPGDIAILVRTHREAKMIQKALGLRRIPSVLNVNASIFNSGEFRDIRLVCEAVADYRREWKIRRALLTDLLGVSGTRLHELGQDETRWEGILNHFRLYHATWAEAGVYRMLVDFLRHEKIREQLLAHHDGERRLTNVLHVLELFHQTESESQCSMSGLLRWAEKNHLEGAEKDEYQIRLETDADAVKIATVHASKGLEFPLVFLPFSWGGGVYRGDCYFHNPENNHELTWDLEKTSDNKNLAKQETLAENLRLLYVAITRAKHCCWVAWGDIPSTGDSCFRYLFHKGSKEIDPADLERLRDSSVGTISLIELPEGGNEVYTPPQTTFSSMRCMEFHGNLKQGWGISSFSGIASRKKDLLEGLDHDRFQPVQAESITEEIVQIPESGSMLFFPGGARTGDCFHEILEWADLNDPDLEKREALVQEKFRKYDFDPGLTTVGVNLIGDIAGRKITSDYQGAKAFSLAEIKTADLIKEMGFHFSIRGIEGWRLVEGIRDYCRTASHHALLETLQKLKFTTLKGFMKGFVDLVFCHEGRFYILDWKTNNLGSEIQDYMPVLLQQAIHDHLFNLQYYIYTVALHKYLRLRMGVKYDFNQHFGGVYYFFLRGITADNHSAGVFYDSLADSREFIEMFEKILGQETE